MAESKVMQLIGEWTDEKRYPIVADNEDMEYIADAMTEMEMMRDIYLQMDGGSGYYKTMRVILEVIYCMGFEAGREAERQETELQFGDEAAQ